MILGDLRAVTFTVPTLDPVVQAYTACLGFRLHATGRIDAATAARWSAPATAGCAYAVLVPERGPTCLRFIEDPAAGTVAAFTTHGWNATELTVQDTDALATRLAGTPFQVIGPPRPLPGFAGIRVMQAMGPAGEVLYLTDVAADPSLPVAAAPVGQVFIVVAGGPDLAAMADFYRGSCNHHVSRPVDIPLGAFNHANALPADTRHAIALVTLAGGTRIEIDCYPARVGPRPIVPGHLPPGMALVSCGRAALMPSGAESCICVTGAAGELIEY